MDRKLFYTIIVFMFLLLLSTYSAANEASFFLPFHNLDKSHWYFSNGWVNGDHQACEWSEEAVSIIDNKLQMKLFEYGGKLRPYACPEIHTINTTGYGVYESRMRTAAGLGLNTNMFTYVGPPTGSKEHDEIDFEFLGKDPNTVQINYFTNAQGHHEVIIPLGFNATEALHNYAIEWLPDKIKWYVDGRMVHETPDGASLPRNPTRLYLSLWAGSSVEDSWLGTFHFSKPVTAQIEWASYTPQGQHCLFPQSITCNK